jgi:hypothetical protein
MGRIARGLLFYHGRTVQTMLLAFIWELAFPSHSLSSLSKQVDALPFLGRRGRAIPLQEFLLLNPTLSIKGQYGPWLDKNRLFKVLLL